MEHIVQFAIGLDDDAIRRELEANAVKQIEKDLKQELIDRMFDADNGWGRYSKHANPQSDPLAAWVRNMVAETLIQYRDQIIERAAECLAESMKRSKAVREATAGVAKQIEQDVLQSAT